MARRIGQADQKVEKTCEIDRYKLEQTTGMFECFGQRDKMSREIEWKNRSRIFRLG